MLSFGFLCVCFCITVFLPRTDYWNDNVVIVDLKISNLISIFIDDFGDCMFSQKTRLLIERKLPKIMLLSEN